MYLNTEVKKDIFQKLGFAQKAEDTGSVESQVALFTHRINHLNQHLNSNPKDYSTRLGLLKLVGKRRNLLDYIFKKDIMRYRALIAKLEIRK